MQLFASLLNDVLRDSSPSDLVVILGPEAHLREHIPAGALLRREERKAHLYYIEFQFPEDPMTRLVRQSIEVMRPSAEPLQTQLLGSVQFDREPIGWDPIEEAVGHYKAKTIVVRRPEDFASAIRLMKPRGQ